MRILDQYILSRFLYNFFSSFVILMFIFIFQAIWLFIDDFAGKGLDIAIISKFFLYMMPSLTEKVLPLTVLLSSILTFGSFAENYEFAAMKASGISLQRSMLSLIVFVTFLGGVTFYFANSVIPASEQKIYNMRRNIAKVKPAAAIEEGVFSDFEGMSIKVDSKHGEKDRFLNNVIIHQKTATQINKTVIKAKTGELISSEDSEVIQLVLRDGNHYEDVEVKDSRDKLKHPFLKTEFEIYRMNIEAPELGGEDLEAEGGISTDKMKSVGRLTKDIDSLRNDNLKIVRAFSKNISHRAGAFPFIKKDTVKINLNEKLIKADSTNLLRQPDDLVKVIADSIKTTANVIGLFNEWQQIQLYTSAKNNITNVISSIKGKKEELDKRYEIYNRHILSLHKKFALALSCIILFFVGAPLGAIIRKGGIGLPLVIAVLLFLVYYFLGVFAENYAKKSNIHPILGAWLSTMIMLPLGIFLTKRATADKGMMNFGNAIDYFKKLFRKKKEIENA
ncbi:LptF/LptG family permease [Aurantibacter crassamenti]|nr:LptF/LptG family permease [Aurantibacter crassamenti]MBM1107309.1 LptF/LptG family permease [Aurantibacter crassamenti]